MRVDGSISGRTDHMLVLTIWNVDLCIGVLVLLCKAEIDNMDQGVKLANTHEEIFRLDITVDERFVMNVFDPG